MYVYVFTMYLLQCMCIYVTLVGESGTKENPLHVVMQPRQRMCMCMCACTVYMYIYSFFMAHRVIPMIAFPYVRTIYMCIYISDV